ncbi:MAG: ABC transporter substrate-binding protein [Candidatus Thermoplasmatota archaeon]|nr:ABC transporter substrate-binding protein [Candidatus Thermoplasmatota archaeon]
MTGVEKGSDTRRSAIALAILMAFMFLAFFGAVAQVALAGETRQDLILRIGAQDELKSRNILAIGDVWSTNVLGPIYESVGQVDPTTENPVPYNLLGIDANEDGVFEESEYGVYTKLTNQSEVTAFYDLNGVHFHDGVQATMHDVLFAYHLNALDPITTSLDVLKDKNNLPGTNYSTSRWLHVWPVEAEWVDAIPKGANESLRFALHFKQQATYARFTDWTLNGGSILPRHIWEGTGRLCLDATDGVCSNWRENIHLDFKRAYDDSTHNGVPATETFAFKFSDAESWLMEDNEVIGTGPFSFGIWTPGVTVKIDKNWDYKADVVACEKVGTPPVCTGNFYSYMHQPYIDGMLFKIYKTAQAAVFALQAGEIDVVSWSVPPEFVGELIRDPNVEITATAEKGFFYLSYNMRISPFGYPDNDPTQGDVGLWLRKAIAHVIDKKRIVTTLLQNFGVRGDQPVSPGFTKWYNASVTKYDYDLETAKEILDDHYTESFQGGDGLGWAGGWRILPTIGNQEIELLCPQADYDPIRAQACNMIAGDMRKIGLNADAKLVAFGEIVERLNNRDMQMWVLGWRIGSDPPDYYYAFFYSGNARAGQNYPGFQNETFDSLITAARAELDLEKQTKIIKQCSGLLTDALPYDVLYFRTNIEPYRADRFVNWTVGPAGSIFGGSPQSWIGIHPPVKKTMKVLLELRSSMKASGINETSTQAVTVRVRNIADNTPKQGANVTISLAVPIGQLAYGTQQGGSVSGLSDVNGNFIATYVAPVWNETVNDTERLTITASAEFEGEETGQVLADVLIYPRGRPFLAVLTKWTVSDIVLTKDSVPLEVEVTDQDGITVNGAEVTVTPEVGGPTVSPEIGVTSGGKADFIITAPKKVSDTANAEVDFLFRVQATAAGLASEPYQILLTVKEKGGDDGGFDMTIPAIGAAVAIVAVVVIASFLAVKKKPKRRRKRNK